MVDALGQLLGFHWVGILNILKEFGREGWDTTEVEVLAAGDGVANLEGTATIGQTDNVAWPALIDNLFLGSHEAGRSRETHLLVEAHMFIIGTALELAGTDLDESDAGTVVGIHVGMNLEDKTREGFFLGLDHALDCSGRTWRRSNLTEAIEQLLDTEVIERRTKEDGSQVTIQISLMVEVGIDAREEFYVLAQLVGILLSDTSIQFGVVETVDCHTLGDGLLAGGIEVEALLVEVIDTLETLADIDWPSHWATRDFELLLQLVHEVEGVLALTVHLVDKDDDWSIAHTAHLHQLVGLALDTLGAVDDDDDRIDGSQGSEGIFLEILVTWRIEDIDLIFLALNGIVERKDGSSYRDTTLALYLHEVGGGSLLDLIALDSTSHMDGATKKE